MPGDQPCCHLSQPFSLWVRDFRDLNEREVSCAYTCPISGFTNSPPLDALYGCNRNVLLVRAPIIQCGYKPEKKQAKLCLARTSRDVGAQTDLCPGREYLGRAGSAWTRTEAIRRRLGDCGFHNLYGQSCRE